MEAPIPRAAPVITSTPELSATVDFLPSKLLEIETRCRRSDAKRCEVTHSYDQAKAGGAPDHSSAMP
jgi:hypothetical protein